jgi:FkbM family methyltransferase
MSIVENKVIRRLLLPLFARINPGDIRIRHHYTGDRFHLHSFRHKGYWFHGRRRERETLERFAALIQPGDAVIEVGGHIGYISLYFSKLVGEYGTVFVFEPGPNNVAYIRKNVRNRSNVRLIEKALSDKTGKVDFFVEHLSGQNNTLLGNYDVFNENSSLANWNSGYQQVTVDAMQLDEFIDQEGVAPSFLKIDVEGAEYLVLSGAGDCLSTHRPILMVEITNRPDEVCQLMEDYGYLAVDPQGHVTDGSTNVEGNIFFLHCEQHAQQIQQLTHTLAKAA